MAHSASSASPPPLLAVRQAAAAIAAQLNTGGSGKGKGFGDGAGGRKLSVDVPVLESGAAASVQLAQELIAALPKQLAKQFTIVSCADGGAAPAGGSSGGGVPVLGLQQALGGADLGGCLLITAPSSEQVRARAGEVRWRLLVGANAEHAVVVQDAAAQHSLCAAKLSD